MSAYICAREGCNNEVTSGHGSKFCCRKCRDLNRQMQHPEACAASREKYNQKRREKRKADPYYGDVPRRAQAQAKAQAQQAPWGVRFERIREKYGVRYDDRNAPAKDVIGTWKASKIG